MFRSRKSSWIGWFWTTWSPRATATLPNSSLEQPTSRVSPLHLYRRTRVDIRKAVQAGQISDAIEKTNDLDPEILEKRTDLYLDLQLQQLTELISNGQVEEALEFAQQQVAPLCINQQSKLEALEDVMALLAFEKLHTSPVAHLVHEDHRREVASRLNKAILHSLRIQEEPRLPGLLQMVSWAQQTLKQVGSNEIPQFDFKTLKFEIKTDDDSNEQEMNEVVEECA
eukprot:TRINITY_DN6921_c0_g2_i6.p1 TRINITY_DN6921_c0_g2~~TRINITY_DN6921_c0_g2_i6.p1  ORF type:complete len:226 (-),score=31.73 TRINITY_DN6921_c0_g2_i6:183-860(-)